jgi:transcriptional regulator with XRE-family HTH domain
MNKVREARKIRGLRQIELQNKAKIDTCRISHIENGLVTPRQDEKERLSAALKIPMKELFPKGE